MNRFFEEHPTLASALGVILFLASIAVLSLLAGCKPQQHIVEIVKTDTLHVYHTDTLKVVHNDTIFSTITTVQHDSVMLKQKEIYYINAATGEILHSEKEKEKESYHNNEKDSQLIRHTVDSLVQAKVDSIYQSKHEDKPVIVEVEKEIPWYQKTWQWIKDRLAYLGITVLIFILLDIFGDKIKNWIKKLIKGRSII